MAISSVLVETSIPARLDRLRWGRFHTLVVVALGITWILDGLEVTLAGAISPALKESHRLRFSNADVGLVSSAYVDRRSGRRRQARPTAHRDREGFSTKQLTYVMAKSHDCRVIMRYLVWVVCHHDVDRSQDVSCLCA